MRFAARRRRQESSSHGGLSGVEPMHGVGAGRLSGSYERRSGIGLRNRIDRQTVRSGCLL